MQYPNYSFKPSEDIYLKRKQPAVNKSHMKFFVASIAITLSSYYLISIYKQWIVSLPFWKTIRDDKLLLKESYELAIQGNHPMRKTIIQQFSQF